MRYLVRSSNRWFIQTFEADCPVNAAQQAIREMIPNDYEGQLWVYPYEEMFTFDVSREATPVTTKKMEPYKKEEPVSIWEKILYWVIG